jgi:hypothetical protein
MPIYGDLRRESGLIIENMVWSLNWIGRPCGMSEL